LLYHKSLLVSLASDEMLLSCAMRIALAQQAEYNASMAVN